MKALFVLCFFQVVIVCAQEKRYDLHIHENGNTKKNDENSSGMPKTVEQRDANVYCEFY